MTELDIREWGVLALIALSAIPWVVLIVTWWRWDRQDYG